AFDNRFFVYVDRRSDKASSDIGRRSRRARMGDGGTVCECRPISRAGAFVFAAGVCSGVSECHRRRAELSGSRWCGYSGGGAEEGGNGRRGEGATGDLLTR